MEEPDFFVRKNDLYKYVGLRTTQIDALIKAGKFPKGVVLAEGGRAVAWPARELRRWQDERIAQRDAA